ncbi:MAG TPA: M3 family oligoendopeptidase [Planctomycetota bacterium]
MTTPTPAVDDRYPAPVPRLLPAGFRPDAWSDLEPLYRELETRALPDSVALEQWLLDRSEVDSAFAGEASRRMVAAACDTADDETEARHLDYQTVVLPEVKIVSDRLDRRYLESPHRLQLDRARWLVHDRDTELAVRLFREENVALEAKEERLCTEYGRITGAMTVEWRGRTWTLQALGKFLEENDAGLREEVWRMIWRRRLQDRERLDSLFDELLGLRGKMAANAGFANFRDYRHLEYGRFDYTPDDCLALHANVEEHVLPLHRRMLAERRRRLELDVLRPWDLSVDLEGRPPFEPFQDQAGHVAVARRLLDAVDPVFGADLVWMAERGLLDLETRPNKRPGGFMDTFEDARVPFVFANSGTTHGDVETLIHESGHAAHALLCRELEPVGYRSAPLEFSEVASMAMECMAMEHIAVAYPPAEARRAARDSFEGIVAGLPWIATVDAFQQRLYTQERTDRAARTELWREMRARFGGDVDWSGLETEQAAGWQRQLHLFEVPFYYVEYAIAQIGALQVWMRYRRDPQAAVAEYRNGLRRGGSRPLPELYAAAGIRFDPRGETLGELMTEVETAWSALLQ